MGKFVISTDKKGGARFVLKAGNGEIIATSETYSSPDSCKRGIESVRKNCSAPVEDQTQEGFEKLPCPKYELYTDKKGEFRFRLKAGNGEIIAASEGYTAKGSCKNGIESVGRNAPDAEIAEAE
ncbi:MAG: YegP family protein [Oscillospiraceae bacterium]|nr:YegP family protein [Oscillospiraceae bacterium]